MWVRRWRIEWGSEKDCVSFHRGGCLSKGVFFPFLTGAVMECAWIDPVQSGLCLGFVPGACRVSAGSYPCLHTDRGNATIIPCPFFTYFFTHIVD